MAKLIGLCRTSQESLQGTARYRDSDLVWLSSNGVVTGAIHIGRVV
jgi:hypothetical protein